MARELQVLHFDANEVRRTLPTDRLAGVALAERGEVWKPSRHPSQRSIVTWWWAATNRRLVGCRSLERLSTAMLLDFHPGVVDFGDLTAGLDQIENFAAELRRVAAGHEDSLRKCGLTDCPATRLHRTRGTSRALPNPGRFTGRTPAHQPRQQRFRSIHRARGKVRLTGPQRPSTSRHQAAASGAR
jgi:hypothetical protein